ncbi:MAG: hypothetical protein CME70_20990 [Halobacteriovorax sp.]|nr:hypothetical protein [Halobacteriovorax sp.]|tara:strand:- start:52369 stop:53292 length:924 start_codon:yes stop_codon:yes gene_type:complete
MKIYGLSVLSNALKDNTCFRESVASLHSICDETHVFIKKSIDGTEVALKNSEGFQIHSFDEDSEPDQLQFLRESCENIPEAWVLSIEADEVLNLSDLELLKEDIKRATELNCEAIAFRNLNFLKDPHHISISNEYPAHSIRLFRLGSNEYFKQEELIFDQKVYYSEVKIFNYLNLRREKEKEDLDYRESELLPYLGPQPPIMKRRIENWGGVWDRLTVAKVYILGEPRDYKAEFIERIKAKKIIWAGNIVEIPAEDRTKAVIVEPTLFQKIFRPSFVPKKSKAKNAHTWDKEFMLILKLSEKGIAVS